MVVREGLAKDLHQRITRIERISFSCNYKGTIKHKDHMVCNYPYFTGKCKNIVEYEADVPYAGTYHGNIPINRHDCQCGLIAHLITLFDHQQTDISQRYQDLYAENERLRARLEALEASQAQPERPSPPPVSPPAAASVSQPAPLQALLRVTEPREAQRELQEIARMVGTKKAGRPRALSPEAVAWAVELGEIFPKEDVAKLFGISVSTLYSYTRETKAE